MAVTTIERRVSRTVDEDHRGMEVEVREFEIKGEAESGQPIWPSTIFSGPTAVQFYSYDTDGAQLVLDPAIGAKIPHGQIQPSPMMYLAERSCDWNEDHGRSLRAIFTYKVMPDPEDLIWEADLSLQSETTPVDINGQPIRINGKLTPVDRLKPSIELVGRKHNVQENAGFWNCILALLGRVNGGIVTLNGTLTFPCDTLLYSGCMVQRIADDRITVEHHLLYDANGWKHVVWDPDTGGATEIDLYARGNFQCLWLTVGATNASYEACPPEEPPPLP